MPDIPMVGGAYEARSVNINAQRCINLYPEMEGEGGKNVAALIGTPGTKEFTDLGTSGPVMGLHSDSQQAYAVSDNKFFTISPSGSVSQKGVIDSVEGAPAERISMADNPFQVMVVDGTKEGYIYTKSSGEFAKISDSVAGAAFPGGLNVAFQDGYFIVTKPETDEFYISALSNGKSWDALDFASAEGFSDELVAVESDHRELWLFGEQTIEVWYNSGGSDFPFERIQGGFQETGCIATFSVAKMDNSIFWLGRDERGDGIVYRANGYVPQRVSTHAIEKAIQSYERKDDAFAYAYQQEGHLFYVLTFPTANATWVYDASTNLWHERQYYDGMEDFRHRSNCFCYLGGKLLVGDFLNGKIYEYDLDKYDDDGDTIKRIRDAYHVHNDRKRSTCFRYDLDMEFGIGLNLGQGTDPQVSLSISKDGGHNYGNELWRTFGKIGQYDIRAVWYRLGVSRVWTMRMLITDPVKVVLISAKGDFSGSDW